jgi:hypothetical protein
MPLWRLISDVREQEKQDSGHEMAHNMSFLLTKRLERRTPATKLLEKAIFFSQWLEKR